MFTESTVSNTNHNHQNYNNNNNNYKNPKSPKQRKKQTKNYIEENSEQDSITSAVKSQLMTSLDVLSNPMTIETGHAEKKCPSTASPDVETPMTDMSTLGRSSSSLNLPSISAKDKRKNEKLLRLNLCGESFQLLRKNLKNFKSRSLSILKKLDENQYTLLERFSKMSHEQRLAHCDHFIGESQEYFFDRDSRCFKEVLQYYRSGQLHFSPDVCLETFLGEMNHWQIPLDQFADCCQDVLGLSDDKSDSPDKPDTSGNPEMGFENNGAATGATGLSRWRNRAYDLIENPASSKTAKIYAMFSAGAVLVSVLTMIVASLPACQMPNPENPRESVPKPFFQMVEWICIIWFTVEFLARFILTRRKCKFLLVPLNIVDVLSILPFHIEFLVRSVFGVSFDSIDNIQGALLVLRILRVLRVMRIFKLARYSGGLFSLGTTLSSSVREIGLLFTFMSITIILYSTTVYYLEKDELNSKFTSIPATFWWCIVTMTTVGYGDMVPTTIGGKLIATFTSISGVIVLAFPITLIVENFNRNYSPRGKTAPKKKTPRRRARVQEAEEEPPIAVVRMF